MDDPLMDLSSRDVNCGVILTIAECSTAVSELPGSPADASGTVATFFCPVSCNACSEYCASPWADDSEQPAATPEPVPEPEPVPVDDAPQTPESEEGQSPEPTKEPSTPEAESSGSWTPTALQRENERKSA